MSLEEHPGEPETGQGLRLCEHEETAQSFLQTPPLPTLLPGTLFCSSAPGPLVQDLTCDLQSFRKKLLELLGAHGEEVNGALDKNLRNESHPENIQKRGLD